MPHDESAVDDLLHASRLVLRTPTLVYVFVAGAMISFGMNGIVGWGPTFMTREFSLSTGTAAGLLHAYLERADKERLDAKMRARYTIAPSVRIMSKIAPTLR